MNGKSLYLDSSAIVKSVVPEAESRALAELLRDWPARVSSALARVEVRRALRRAGAPRFVLDRGEEALQGIVLLAISDAVLDAAAAVEPRTVRSLDAIHLASALSV